MSKWLLLSAKMQLYYVYLTIEQKLIKQQFKRKVIQSFVF